MDGNLAEKIAENFDSVIISLDSWVRKEFNMLRPGGSFSRVWKGVRQLTEAGVNNLAIRQERTRFNYLNDDNNRKLGSS